MALVRLQKFLSECGVASRRRSEELIVEGKVKVNNRTVTELGTKIDPDKDKVSVRNKPVAAAHKGIILFHKPREVISTLSDPEGRPCVGDFLSKQYRSYFPVGRLDWETSGLMVLTNDGELADRLMHPKYNFERIYQARVEGSVSETTLEKMKRGVTLADGKATAHATIMSNDEKSTWIEVSVKEGRNRLVRRMMDKLRHSIIKLRRISHGPFHIGKLKSGDMLKLGEKQYQFYRERVLNYKPDFKKEVNDRSEYTSSESRRGDSKYGERKRKSAFDNKKKFSREKSRRRPEDTPRKDSKSRDYKPFDKPRKPQGNKRPDRFRSKKPAKSR